MSVFFEYPISLLGNNSSYSVINILTSDEELFGKQVSCNIVDGESLISIFSNTGYCSFKVNFIGTYIITCDNINTKVIIEEIGQVYEVDFNPQIINYTMLFDKGDECKNITGGWENANVWVNATHTFVNNNSCITAGGTNISGGGVGVATINKIDLSQYSKLVMNGSGNLTRVYTGYTGKLITGICTDANTTYGKYSVYDGLIVEYSTKLNERDIYVLNLKYKVSAYVVFIMNQVHDASVTLYNSFLLKDDNYQKLLDVFDLSISDYPTIEDLINNSIFDSLFNTEFFVKYLIRNCTGSIMMSIINSEKGLNTIRNSIYNERLFSNIHWNKFLNMVGEIPDSERFYLYNNGDECEYITGGYESVILQHSTYITNGITTTKNNDNLKIEVAANTGTPHEGFWVSKNLINFTKYSKLKIRSLQTGHCDSIRSLLRIVEQKPTSTNNSIHQIAALVITSTQYEVIELDISAITGSYYILLNQYSYLAVQSKFEVNKIWLE